MITRRSLFTALAGLVGAPLVSPAMATEARRAWIEERGRRAYEEILQGTPWYSGPFHMLKAEYGVDGKATIVTVERRINGRLAKSVYGGPSAQRELERIGVGSQS